MRERASPASSTVVHQNSGEKALGSSSSTSTTRDIAHRILEAYDNVSSRNSKRHRDVEDLLREGVAQTAWSDIVEVLHQEAGRSGPRASKFITLLLSELLKLSYKSNDVLTSGLCSRIGDLLCAFSMIDLRHDLQPVINPLTTATGSLLLHFLAAIIRDPASAQHSDRSRVVDDLLLLLGFGPHLRVRPVPRQAEVNELLSTKPDEPAADVSAEVKGVKDCKDVPAFGVQRDHPISASKLSLLAALLANELPLLLGDSRLAIAVPLKGEILRQTILPVLPELLLLNTRIKAPPEIINTSVLAISTMDNWLRCDLPHMLLKPDRSPDTKDDMREEDLDRRRPDLYAALQPLVLRSILQHPLILSFERLLADPTTTSAAADLFDSLCDCSNHASSVNEDGSALKVPFIRGLFSSIEEDASRESGTHVPETRAASSFLWKESLTTTKDLNTDTPFGSDRGQSNIYRWIARDEKGLLLSLTNLDMVILNTTWNISTVLEAYSSWTSPLATDSNQLYLSYFKCFKSFCEASCGKLILTLMTDSQVGANATACVRRAVSFAAYTNPILCSGRRAQLAFVDSVISFASVFLRLLDESSAAMGRNRGKGSNFQVWQLSISVALVRGVLRRFATPLVAELYQHLLPYNSRWPLSEWLIYRDRCTELLLDMSLLLDSTLVTCPVLDDLKAWRVNLPDDATPPHWTKIEAALLLIAHTAGRAAVSRDASPALTLDLLLRLHFPEECFPGSLMRCSAARVLLWCCGHVGTDIPKFKHLFRMLESMLWFVMDSKESLIHHGCPATTVRCWQQLIAEAVVVNASTAVIHLSSLGRQENCFSGAVETSGVQHSGDELLSAMGPSNQRKTPACDNAAASLTGIDNIGDSDSNAFAVEVAEELMRLARSRNHGGEVLKTLVYGAARLVCDTAEVGGWLDFFDRTCQELFINYDSVRRSSAMRRHHTDEIEQGIVVPRTERIRRHVYTESQLRLAIEGGFLHHVTALLLPFCENRTFAIGALNSPYVEFAAALLTWLVHSKGDMPLSCSDHALSPLLTSIYRLVSLTADSHLRRLQVLDKALGVAIYADSDPFSNCITSFALSWVRLLCKSSDTDVTRPLHFVFEATLSKATALLSAITSENGSAITDFSGQPCVSYLQIVISALSSTSHPWRILQYRKLVKSLASVTLIAIGDPVCPLHVQEFCTVFLLRLLEATRRIPHDGIGALTSDDLRETGSLSTLTYVPQSCHIIKALSRVAEAPWSSRRLCRFAVVLLKAYLDYWQSDGRAQVPMDHIGASKMVHVDHSDPSATLQEVLVALRSRLAQLAPT